MIHLSGIFVTVTRVAPKQTKGLGIRLFSMRFKASLQRNCRCANLCLLYLLIGKKKPEKYAAKIKEAQASIQDRIIDLAKMKLELGKHCPPDELEGGEPLDEAEQDEMYDNRHFL